VLIAADLSETSLVVLLLEGMTRSELSRAAAAAADHTSPSSHEQDEILTLQEVAAFVRVPEQTLRYWRHLGKGPHGFRLGRFVRYWRSDVLLWLEQTSHPQNSQ